MKRAAILRFWICLACAGLSLVLGFQTVWAHDYSTPDPIGMNLSDNYILDHDDQAPYKGWINIDLTNTGTQAWGDFHFSIVDTGSGTQGVVFDVDGYEDGNGDWVDTTPQKDGLSFDPSGFMLSQNGQQLDLYFYSEPLNPDESTSLSVYTENPNQVDFFGVSFNPTQVPLPASILLLGAGFVGIAGYRRKTLQRT